MKTVDMNPLFEAKTFAEGVQLLAAMKLPKEEADRAMAPIYFVSFGERYPHDARFAMTGMAPTGATFYNPPRIEIYEEGVPKIWAHSYLTNDPDHVPMARMLAFTVIHEMAHLVAGGGLSNRDSHENPVWADAAKRMGIREEVYSKKGPDWKYGMFFTDQELWQKIKELPSYPGDF